MDLEKSELKGFFRVNSYKHKKILEVFFSFLQNITNRPMTCAYRLWYTFLYKTLRDFLCR
jgi:hypothetical protein